MIPVLYPSTETAFENNGLGGLPDAISCVVTEQRNTQGGYYLEMEYPIDGLHFDLLAPERIIYAAPSMGNTPQPFRISRITRPINGIVHIEAPHLCAELQKLTSWGVDTGTNIQGMIYNQFYRARQLGQTVPFWCETDITVESDVTFSHPEPTSLADILLGSEGSVLDVVGGEYEFDGYHIILHNQRGVDSGLEIRYGVNMSDLEAETDATELVTACVPYWKGTVNDVETVVIGDMCSASNASAYAYVRCIPLDVSQQFEETDTQPTKADVTAKGQAFINSTSRKLLQTSIRVSYEPTTSGIGERRINLCDTVRVVYPDLAVSSISKVVETKFNVLVERYDELTIGTIRNNIVDTIAGLISGGATYSGGGSGSGGGGSAVGAVLYNMPQNLNEAQKAQARSNIGVGSGGEAVVNLPFVSPDNYGAVGDGVTDDTNALISCFEYANSVKMPVVWHDKTIYLKTATAQNCPVINTDVDFSGCTILMDSNNQGETILKIGDDPTAFSVTGLDATNFETVFSAYSNCVVTVDSNMSLGQRQGDPTTPYFHKQTFLTNDYGVIQPFNLYTPITSVRSCYAVDRYAEPITVRLGTIVADGVNYPAEILVQRSNVTVCDTAIEPRNITSVSWKNGLFTARHGFGIKFRNIHGNNIQANSSATVTAYLFDAYSCYGLQFERLSFIKNWGGVATHFCTDVTMRDCDCGRMDYHYGVYGDNLVDNCRFFGYPAQISVGYGDGKVTVRDSAIYKREEGSLYDNGVVLCRADFAIMYSGDMILDNVTVYMTDVENISYVWLMKYQLQSSAFQSLLSFAPRIAPSLKAKLNLKTDTPNSTDKLALLRFENTISGETIRLRDIGIEVDDPSLIAASGDVDFTGFDTTASEIRIVNGRLSSNSYAGTVLCNAAIASRISAPSAKIRYLDGSPVTVQHGVETVTLLSTETSVYTDVVLPFSMPNTNYSILLSATGGNQNYRVFVQSENKLQSGFRIFVFNDNKTAFDVDRTISISWAVIG